MTAANIVVLRAPPGLPVDPPSHQPIPAEPDEFAFVRSGDKGFHPETFSDFKGVFLVATVWLVAYILMAINYLLN